MSSFFSKQLEENLVCTSDGKFLEIEVNTSSTKEALDLVIRYFYTGKMNFESLSLKDLLDLLNLLVFLEMYELYTLVEVFTKKKIEEGSFSLEKILILSSTAEAYCFYSIISSMHFYLDQNISYVSKLHEVRYLSQDFLEDLIKHDMEGNFNRAKYFSKFGVGLKTQTKKMHLGKTSKKKISKKNDIVQKGGEVSEKNQILNV